MENHFICFPVTAQAVCFVIWGISIEFFSYWLFKIYFCWHAVDLQQCIGFCCTAKWISYTWVSYPRVYNMDIYKHVCMSIYVACIVCLPVHSCFTYVYIYTYKYLHWDPYIHISIGPIPWHISLSKWEGGGWWWASSFILFLVKLGRCHSFPVS